MKNIPSQEEANADFFRRSKAEWDSMGGHPSVKKIERALKVIDKAIDCRRAAKAKRASTNGGSGT